MRMLINTEKISMKVFVVGLVILCFDYEHIYNYLILNVIAINKRTKSGKSKAKKSRRSSIMLIPPDHSTFECSDEAEKSPSNLLTSLSTSKVVTPPRVAKIVKRAQTTTSKAQLSSEELLMRKIESEKAAEFARTMKARKLYLLLKTKSVDHPPTTVASKRKEKVVKKVQIRIKSCQALAIAMRSRRVSSKKTITGNTIIEPFQFATDKRIVTTEPKLSSKGCATPVAEKALKFMKDARSHGVRR